MRISKHFNILLVENVWSQLVFLSDMFVKLFDFNLDCFIDILKYAFKRFFLTNNWFELLFTFFPFQNIAACLLWGALQWNVYLPRSMKIICFKAWNHIFPWKQPTLSNKLYCNILHVLVVVILSGFMIPSNDIISDQCTIYILKRNQN